jgi:ATP phosphoribosyltransferase
MLKLVLPKGSLEKATMELFDAADLSVRRSSVVDYRATIEDPRIDEVRILRPQEIPRYVAEGLFDLGITGRDWVEETGAEVVSLGELRYSKASASPVRLVVAVPDGSPIHDVAQLHQGVRVSTEYPELTRRFFADRGIEADIRLSYGATEAKVPDIVDVAVDLTETGRALRAAGLRIIDTIITSYTELIANPASRADPGKAHAMDQLLTLLQGALEARTKVLVKLNVSDGTCLDRVIELLPSMKAPTVNELHGGAGFAVETVVPKAEINLLIPALKDAGASDIIELALAKIVH